MESGFKRSKRLLEEVVIPLSLCLCDRQSQGNTEITQKVFNERLNKEISDAPPGTFESTSAVQVTAIDS